jgi:5-methylcytosine-specific restriction endonuclease McrA
MTMNILAAADALSSQDLLDQLHVLAGKERCASANLVAHLAALEARPSVYAAKGYGSLFAYCTEALRLSEDAACTRIDAARASRLFPMILDRLADGSLSLTSVRMLRRHLTLANHRAVLDRAKGRTCRQIEALIAEIAPQPDVPTSLRKLPAPAAPAPSVGPTVAPRAEAAVAPTPAILPAPARPIVQATAPERYRVQFTIGEETHARLRHVQALLRREIPDGDPAAIFDRALRLLEADVEKKKLGAATRPRSIRRATDKNMQATAHSRDVPQAVRRAVWRRDGGQCGYVSTEGRRCTERTFLEFHHQRAYSKGGLATVDNIALRCRRHNQYEAEVEFGPRGSHRDRRHRGPAMLRDLIRTPSTGP